MWGRTSINTFILYLQKWREHKIYATLASHMLLWEPTMFPELNSFSNDRFQSCKFPTRHLITDVLIEKLILWNEHKGILCTYWLRGRTDVVNIWLRAQREPNIFPCGPTWLGHQAFHHLTAALYLSSFLLASCSAARPFPGPNHAIAYESHWEIFSLVRIFNRIPGRASLMIKWLC